MMNSANLQDAFLDNSKEISRNQQELTVFSTNGFHIESVVLNYDECHPV